MADKTTDNHMSEDFSLNHFTELGGDKKEPTISGAADLIDQTEATAATPPFSPTEDKQRAEFKPITIFAIIAMLIAALAIWLNPGTDAQAVKKTHQQTPHRLKDNAQIHHLESRLAALTERSAQQNSVIEQRLDQLDQQVAALTSLLAKQVSKKGSRRRKQPSSTQVAARPAIQQSAAHRRLPGKTTPGWIVNLISFDSRDDAGKAMARFRAQGVDTEIFPIVLHGKLWYRLRMSGFSNRREAISQKNRMAKKYGIKDAWIQKP